MVERRVGVIVAPRLHLDGHRFTVARIHNKIDFAAFARLVIEELMALRRQLLRHNVLVHAAKVRILLIQVRSLRQRNRITRHQHARIGLVQLKLHRVCGLQKRRFRLINQIGFQRHTRIRQPNEIALVLLITRLRINRVQHEAPRFALQLNGKLIEDALHLQRSHGGILRDIATILPVQALKHLANGSNVAVGVDKPLHRLRHTARDDIGTKIRHERFVDVGLDRRFILAATTH